MLQIRNAYWLFGALFPISIFNFVSVTSRIVSLRDKSYHVSTSLSSNSRVWPKLQSKPCMKQQIKNPSLYEIPLLVRVLYMRCSCLAEASNDSLLAMCWLLRALWMIEVDDLETGCFMSTRCWSISIPLSSNLGLSKRWESIATQTHAQ